VILIHVKPYLTIMPSSLGSLGGVTGLALAPLDRLVESGGLPRPRDERQMASKAPR
jgi:hypothetical protein